MNLDLLELVVLGFVGAGRLPCASAVVMVCRRGMCKTQAAKLQSIPLQSMTYIASQLLCCCRGRVELAKQFIGEMWALPLMVLIVLPPTVFVIVCSGPEIAPWPMLLHDEYCG